jgi:segregation and condensation protein B
MTENQASAELKGKLEALLFASSRPLSVKVLARVLQVEPLEVGSLLAELNRDLSSSTRGVQLRNLSGRWRLETKPDHASAILALNQGYRTKPLSVQALETLAIIALKQPVTTDQVNAVRGVTSLATLETLQKRKLIASVSTYDEAGRSKYWRTTEEFLNEFGLGSIDEVYAAGKIERLFGPVFAIMENGLNNSAQNAESSQELRSPSLNNPATKST